MSEVVYVQIMEFRSLIDFNILFQHICLVKCTSSIRNIDYGLVSVYRMSDTLEKDRNKPINNFVTQNVCQKKMIFQISEIVCESSVPFGLDSHRELYAQFNHYLHRLSCFLLKELSAKNQHSATPLCPSVPLIKSKKAKTRT